jgi:hypothetical protein
VKYVYGVVGVAGAIAAIVVGILGMPEVMIVSGLLGALLIIAANADRILRVKATATGFEAETRAIIDKARATIDQLRVVAKVAVQANLLLVMRAGRWGGFSFEEKERVRTASIEALDLLDVPQKEREAMLAEWHMVNRFDYVHHLLGGHTIPEELKNDLGLQAEWKKLRGGGFEGNPDSGTVEAFLRRAKMLDVDRAELLDDYRHYEKHSQHRRPDVWKRLHDRDK